MTTWIRFATSGASRSADGVKAALARLGPRPQPTVPAPPDVGIVVFDAVSDDVLDLIRGAARGGLVRILAIATSPEALDEVGPWPLLESGASDVLATTDPDELAGEVEARLTRWDEVEALVRSPLVEEALVGRTPAWISLLRQIVEVARFGDASVLLVGEHGTGKNVVARLIHALDPRPFEGDLVTLDCRTLDPALEGAELFGAEPRAHGAAARFPVPARVGALGSADGGTLVLEEIPAFPEALEGDLLRAVEEGAYRPVGAGEWRRTRFRLICSATEGAPGSATSGPSAEAFARRITSWRCRLLPLRERRDDIPAIAERMLGRIHPDLEDVRLDRAVSESLANRDYPANAHDLEALVRRIGIRHVGPGPVTVGAIPPDERPHLEPAERGWQGESLERAIRRAVDAGASLKAIGEAARDAAIRVALAREEGDVKRAARRLGTTARAVESRAAAAAPGRAAPAPGRAPSEPPSVVALPESVVLETGRRSGSEGTRDEP